MQRAHIITLAVMAGILLMAGVITYYYRQTPNDDPDSDAQKTFSLKEGQSFTDLEGQPLTFDAYTGKIRIVNSWASWTPFSAGELRALEELAAEYSQENIAVIAINRNEPKEQAQRFLKTLGTFEHIQFVLDDSDAFYETVDGYAMPETIFYDARGNIVHHKRGDMTKEEMKKLLLETIDASKE